MGKFIMKRLVRKEYWFIPPEANTIAGEFRKQASSVRNQATQLRKVQSALNSDWAGEAKNKYMSQFENTPNELDGYAAWLERQANIIKGIKALRYKWEWEEWK